MVFPVISILEILDLVLKVNVLTPNAYFLTLTIDDKPYKELKKKYKLKDNNDIATKAIRLCLERVRKLTGKSVKQRLS